MKRGDIYFADLSPTMGTKINKTRPVVVVSNNISNMYSDIITIIPLTSNVTKIYPFDVLIPATSLNNLLQDSKAECQQIRAISKARLQSRLIGLLSVSEITRLNSAIALHLNL